MKIIEALKWANEQLKKSVDQKTSTDSTMLEAEILLAFVLSVQKSWLFTHFDDDLREYEFLQFRRLIKRRLHQEPIGYITGVRSFYSRIFQVNPFTLIPRPATETLVQEALDCIDEGKKDETLFIDIGTGSGAIAVTLAAESDIPVIATDVNNQTLAVAKQNAKQHSVFDQIDFRLGSLLEPVISLFKQLNEGGKKNPFTHAILCANLPYLSEQQWKTCATNVRDFEPKLALEAGQDGLSCYIDMFKQLKRHRELFPRNMKVLIEIDPSQKHSATNIILHHFPSTDIEIKKDLEGHDRVVIAKL